MVNTEDHPSTSSEVAAAVTESEKEAAFLRLQAMPVDEVQAKLAELGPLAWKASFLCITALVPFEQLTDPKEIKKNGGSPLVADLSAGVFTGSNFVQLGVGEARLKVALLMHVIESLQSEVIAETRQEELMMGMKAAGKEQA